MNGTIDYYNRNADLFVETTVDVEFKETQDRFLDKLKPGAEILDFGCGSGRDTKYFLEQGYHIEAADGSEEICRIAGVYTGIHVKQMLFQELDETERYDGIWACSSILHLPKRELLPVMKKMQKALKKKGIIYTSFKYGEQEGERNGRYFTDFTKESFTEFLEEVRGLLMEEVWVTRDVRPNRSEEQWLNVILRKEA